MSSPFQSLASRLRRIVSPDQLQAIHASLEREQRSSPCPERAEILNTLASLDWASPDPDFEPDADLEYAARFFATLAEPRALEDGLHPAYEAARWLAQTLMGIDAAPPQCVFERANIDPETVVHDGSGWQADFDPRLGTDDRRVIAQLLMEAALGILCEGIESPAKPLKSSV